MGRSYKVYTANFPWMKKVTGQINHQNWFKLQWTRTTMPQTGRRIANTKSFHTSCFAIWSGSHWNILEPLKMLLEQHQKDDPCCGSLSSIRFFLSLLDIRCLYALIAFSIPWNLWFKKHHTKTHGSPWGMKKIVWNPAVRGYCAGWIATLETTHRQSYQPQRY